MPRYLACVFAVLLLSAVSAAAYAADAGVGTVNAIDCRSESTLYVGEIGNFRVQKVTMK